MRGTSVVVACVVCLIVGVFVGGAMPLAFKGYPREFVREVMVLESPVSEEMSRRMVEEVLVEATAGDESVEPREEWEVRDARYPADWPERVRELGFAEGKVEGAEFYLRSPRRHVRITRVGEMRYRVAVSLLH